MAGEDEALKKQKKVRASKKANLTKLSNEIKALLVLKEHPEKEHVDTVNAKRVEYDNALKELHEAHKAYCDMLNDDEDKEEADGYLISIELKSKGFIAELEQWLEQSKLNVEPGDSASQVGSNVSTTSSAKAQAAARRAALSVKAAMLKEEEELELAELRLHQKKKAMAVQRELAMAEAEEKVYANAIAEAEEKVYATAEERATQPAVKPKFDLNPNASAWVPEPESPADVPLSVSAQQTRLLEAIQLPKAELMEFEGDPLSYWTFMRAFQNSVDNSSLSDHAKLTRLLQYCKGKASRAIQCCAVMDPKVGYKKALSLLKERFGNDFMIAEAWVEKVTKGGIISPNDKQGLREFSDELTSCKETLKSMGYISEVSNQRVLVAISERLPNYLRTRWVREARKIRKKCKRTPSIEELVEFVIDAAEEANDPIYGKLTFRPKESVQTGGKADFLKPRQRGKGVSFSSVTETNKTRTCLKCNEAGHDLLGCDLFKASAPAERFEFACNHRLCFNCLKAGHRAGSCKLNRVCSIPGCGKKHTKFLHLSQKEPAERANVSEVTNSTSQVDVAANVTRLSCEVTGAGDNVVLPIVPVRVRSDKGGKYLHTYALLDTGSTSSFCLEELVHKLGVKGKEQTLSLTTLQAKDSVTKTSVVSLEVEDVNGKNSVRLPSVYSKRDIPISSENIACKEDLEGWSHLHDLELPNVGPEKVGLLIGQDTPEALTPLEVRMGEAGQPYAIRTKLGWCVNGPMGKGKGDHATAYFVSRGEDLDLQIKKFWKIDSNDALSHDMREMSVEDKRAVSVWEETVCLKQGHYELGIPFKERPLNLPNNREVAEQRLQSLGRRLKRDNSLYEKYCQGMEDMLSKGYAHVVPDSELEGSKGCVWYLPHHPVVHPIKADKVRIVYDCASKHCDISLNNNVLQGPDLTNKLLGVLLRFREDGIALMADIESMFHQVKVSPSDWDVLRYLWWPKGDMTKEPQVYRMGVHIFGGRWSPSCCNFALQRVAEDNCEEFNSDTLDTVRNNFYVDDCLKSVTSEEQAVELYSELTELLSKGGFRLTKWITNSVAVLNCIPEEERAKTVKGLDFNHEALPADRALGVYWDVANDSFGYQFCLRDKPVSRRGLLSTVSSVYDPFGFACPFTIVAKLIIQDLCHEGLGWDDNLPTEHLERWVQWKEGLSALGSMKIPRCLKPKGEEGIVKYELHHFSDASEKAYGAVTYMRVVSSGGSIDCNIVMAKAHLAPLKKLTIPRLELCAATLAVKLDSMIRHELSIPLGQSVFWTDSTTVLHYIKSKDKRFKTFVANRVSTIHNGSCPSQWRHVPTHLNPADDASRGLKSEELVRKVTWVRGPEFLLCGEERWPHGIALHAPEADPEVKVNKVKVGSYQTTQQQTPCILQVLLESRSEWHKLLRDVAWLLRFKNYIKVKAFKVEMKNPDKNLSVRDLRLAEEAIVKYVQGQYYAECLKGSSGLEVKKSSPLRKLNPYIAESGVMCVGGRLSNTSLSEGTKHPKILPKQSPVVSLIVRSIHEQNGHVGKEHVLSILREDFWVVGARSIVRKELSKCFVCKRLSAPPGRQQMSHLPCDRVKPDMPPFTYVGIDCFGPFKVKRGRSEVKRYGCIFTCLVVRAIHIEIVFSLDTDSFIQALQRFIARRGTPDEIRSDNGSNFVGAEQELKAVVHSWNQHKVHSYLQQRMIQWKFNPPTASHMGGVWERQIRTTRRVLYSLTREQVINDEALLTLMCIVESIVNSRPLTYVSDDVNDLEPLTPNHLLQLRSRSAFPADTFDKKDIYSKRRWRQVQYLAKVFWHRWVREYLVLLQNRQKWFDPERNFQCGDIVLVVDSDLPRNKWVLGRVTETFPGKDNLVRTVRVKAKDTSFVRPVTKLCLLETVERVESVDTV